MVVLAGAGSGCSEVIGLADLVYDRDPASVQAPPGMVAFDDGSGTAAFIDAYEVTVAEYLAWLDGGAQPVLGGERCGWNDSLVPNVPSAGGDASDCATNGFDWAAAQAERDLPVRCVDWCDAAEFCAQHDKHLCGRTSGGTVETRYDGTEFFLPEPLTSSWYRACSRGGAQAYPYDDAYDALACNGASGAPEASGVRAACEGGYPGLFDMSGNVEEWEDACDAPNGADAACMRRGGAYYAAQVYDPTWLECQRLLPTARGVMASSTGFRCCAGP
jgi:formylglycine-generating enzyme required for sulfatase activity